MQLSARTREPRIARRPPLDYAHVRRESAELAVEEEVAQRARDRAERDIAPRDLVLDKEPNLDALRSGTEIEIEQPRAKHHVDLANVRQADHRVQRSDLDPRTRLFLGFAHGTGEDRLAVLQETRR